MFRFFNPLYKEFDMNQSTTVAAIQLDNGAIQFCKANYPVRLPSTIPPTREELDEQERYWRDDDMLVEVFREVGIMQLFHTPFFKLADKGYQPNH